MDDTAKRESWQQFGAAIDMLENAMVECSETLWSDRKRHPEFWYLAYHTLFWLDLYLSDSADGFAPPAPFTLSELGSEGLMPERVYTQAELLEYLAHCREKCRARIHDMTPTHAAADFVGLGWTGFSNRELLLYNIRHVQHHAAQLNLLLRLAVDSAPRWVARTKRPLEPT